MTLNPPLKLRLDGGALISNYTWLAAQSGTAACGAAIKANGYGLGAREVTKRLWASGCRDFFVAHWGEAAAIADIIPPGNIAVLNGFDADDPAEAIALGALPVLNTPKQIARWKAAGGKRCHVMLDSGINRLGIGPEQIGPEAKGSGLFDGLDIDILLSHLASADEDVAQNDAQLRLFVQMGQAINTRRRSLANSAGIMLGADYHFDLTRPGVSLYGGVARPEMATALQQVVQPQASVLQVRDLPMGAAVGYNATYHCPTAMRVATLAIGYADGYWRSFSGAGAVHFGGVEMPVIGRVSMDLLLVNANAAPYLAEGDWVDIAFDLPRASTLTGMSQYELLTGLGTRGQHVWG